MKHIFLSILLAANLMACCNHACCDRNANTQNPIMPIAYCGGETNSQVLYLTDYLPQVSNFDNLVITTEPSYQVVCVQDGQLTITGDNSLSVLHAEDKDRGKIA